MNEDEPALCECGHDLAAHGPTVSCTLCECSLWMPPETRRALDVIARQPLHVRRTVADLLTEGPGPMIRPGPARLAPGACPGGYVVHLYSVADGRLLMCDELGPDVDVESAATQHAIRTADVDVCLVFFDGDTGERVLPPGASTGDIVG